MSGCLCFDVVNTSDIGIIERFGKFARLAEPGCFFFCCPMEYMAGKVSLRVQELHVSLESKTKDNVFVTVNVSVQYQCIREKVYSAFYMLSDPAAQMRAYVFDIVRASMCQMTLDQSFESKEEISMSVKSHLQETMSTFGYTIIQALVTDLSPDAKVRDAMNEINASRRLKESAYQRAEGEKILKVKRAEAEAESMYLSGVGVAKQRKAIMDGLKISIVDFSQSVSGSTAKDIMDLLVMNQYFDTLQEMGSGNAKCVFLAKDMNPMVSGLMEAHAGK